MILLENISTGYNRPEWPYFIPAILGALIDGSAMPLCTVALVGSMEGPGPRDGGMVMVRRPKCHLGGGGMVYQNTHPSKTKNTATFNNKSGIVFFFLERFAWYLVPKVSTCSGCTFDCC